jgi:hypothetical protein
MGGGLRDRLGADARVGAASNPERKDISALCRLPNMLNPAAALMIRGRVAESRWQ